MQERRRFVRITEDSPISYEVLSDAKSGDFITKDISQAGIRFFVHDFIPKGTLIKIRLILKKITFSFEAIVRVVWIEEDFRNDRYEIGVEFVNISKQASEYLIKYIKDILEISNTS